MTFIPPEELPDLEELLSEKYAIESLKELTDILIEDQAIIQFLPTVARLSNRAREGHFDLVFHIFADNQDNVQDDPLKALSVYLEYRADGCSSIRLYYELYSNRENDEMVEENYLIGYGDYPD